ncbi:regulator of Ty1 Transposition [Sporothrix epigloea]|uniref:Regulator of Ty1 Transposition n=1 Tax=Sporothrix epigloea TaxID=1892477 RepID=A0ABP0DXP4_9PEZI
MAEDGHKSVFGTCRFAFVPGRSLLPKTIAELSRTVTKYGGVALEPEANGQLQLTEASHIVSNSIDFEQYNDAIDMMLPVVTSAWITHSLNRGKLAQIRPFSPDPRMIFSSVNLTCADIPLGDKEAITGATLAFGGMESKDLTRLTTHICALTMDHDKCKEALAKKLRCKIVLPHWFDDCFKLGKKIDETPYLLPDPPILRSLSGGRAGNGDGQATNVVTVPIPDNLDLEGATTPLPDAPPNLGYRSNLTVFQNKRVLLAQDINIGSRFRAVVIELIKRGGGHIVDDGNVDACDMYICHYRDGPDYVQAAQARKTIGNLAWLFHIITNNEWCSPLRRLLHYPVPREGIPGFENFVITLSNYGGEARIYLENLVVAAGAKFTKTMRMDNTHLITACDNSEKCEAARDWNIQMVNHLWIEESYARCEVQSVTNPRYTTFPGRTNLGEIIGQTFFDETKLRALYYAGGNDKIGKAGAHSSSAVKKATHSKKAVGRPKKSIQLDEEPEVLADVSEVQNGQIDGDDDLSTSSEPEPEPETNGKDHNSRQVPQTTANASMATPSRPRKMGQNTDKENESSPLIVGSASRSAKDKALTKLHGLAPDIALYEKEKKRSIRDLKAPWGGKRAADLVDKEKVEAARKKRGSPDAEASEETASEDGERPAKKNRPSLPPVQMRVVLTGYQRWVHHSSKEETERRKLRNLGIQIVQDNQPCDFLAAPCLVRTMKFLKTLARGPEVLNAQFITDVLEKGKLLPTEDYLLRDTEGEARFNVVLSKSLARARANRGRLLWHVVIYCAADIKNGPESYREIAEANGAIFKTYRAHSGTTIRPVASGEEESQPCEPVYLLTSASTAERALWPKFEQMARDGNMLPRIVAPDWLLEVAMRQEVLFDDHFLAENFWSKN